MYNDDELKKFAPQPINNNPGGLTVHHKSKLHRGWLFYSVLGVLLVICISIAVSFFWYQAQLEPVNNDRGVVKVFTIEPGSTSSRIGKELEAQKVIKNALVFEVYARLSGKNGQLKAGTYRLSPSETTQDIFNHFVDGTSLDQFTVTFLPGATLAENKKVLEKAGFTDQDITSAFEVNYDNPLFAGKPENADLEGYIYGESYNFSVGVTVKEILETTFDEFYKQIEENNLEDGFTAQGLDLFRAITLASIIQREVNTENDQKQVAQVFYSRLKSGMVLGSDVTYQYIADKTGQERSPDLDSPYNTRKYPGLPPGPISAPGIGALKAVASPANGDYLFFLSGDDNVTYFAKTYTEHEANITNHCQEKCSTP